MFKDKCYSFVGKPKFHVTTRADGLRPGVAVGHFWSMFGHVAARRHTSSCNFAQMASCMTLNDEVLGSSGPTATFFISFVHFRG